MARCDLSYCVARVKQLLLAFTEMVEVVSCIRVGCYPCRFFELQLGCKLRKDIKLNVLIFSLREKIGIALGKQVFHIYG